MTPRAKSPSKGIHPQLPVITGLMRARVAYLRPSVAGAGRIVRKIAAPAGGLGFAGRGRNAAPKWAPSAQHNRSRRDATVHSEFVIIQVNVEVLTHDDASVLE